MTTPLSTLLGQPYSFDPNIRITESFYYLKDPVNETTSLLQPGFCGPTMAALMGGGHDHRLAREHPSLLIQILIWHYYNCYCQIKLSISCFHSRGLKLCKCVGTKEFFYMRKEFNPHMTFSVHQHFIVLYINIIWKKENSNTRKLRKNSKLQHGQDNVMRKWSMMHLEKASVNHITFLVWILWCYLMSMRGANFAFDGQLDD